MKDMVIVASLLWGLSWFLRFLTTLNPLAALTLFLLFIICLTIFSCLWLRLEAIRDAKRLIEENSEIIFYKLIDTGHGYTLVYLTEGIGRKKVELGGKHPDLRDLKDLTIGQTLYLSPNTEIFLKRNMLVAGRYIRFTTVPKQQDFPQALSQTART
jgi:hypothetical protein